MLGHAGSTSNIGGRSVLACCAINATLHASHTAGTVVPLRNRRFMARIVALSRARGATVGGMTLRRTLIALFGLTAAVVAVVLSQPQTIQGQSRATPQIVTAANA